MNVIRIAVLATIVLLCATAGRALSNPTGSDDPAFHIGATPEPGTIVMLLTGLGGLGGLSYWRKRGRS
jgi:hypothetical protein